jgi:hypothetical protein
VYHFHYRRRTNMLLRQPAAREARKQDHRRPNHLAFDGYCASNEPLNGLAAIRKFLLNRRTYLRKLNGDNGKQIH